jgi:hypothetical protein
VDFEYVHTALDLFICFFPYIDYINNYRTILKHEWEKLWMAAVTAYFTILSQHLPGTTDEYHKKAQYGWLISKPLKNHIQLLRGLDEYSLLCECAGIWSV